MACKRVGHVQGRRLVIEEYCRHAGEIGGKVGRWETDSALKEKTYSAIVIELIAVPNLGMTKTFPRSSRITFFCNSLKA